MLLLTSQKEKILQFATTKCHRHIVSLMATILNNLKRKSNYPKTCLVETAIRFHELIIIICIMICASSFSP